MLDYNLKGITIYYELHSIIIFLVLNNLPNNIKIKFYK